MFFERLLVGLGISVYMCFIFLFNLVKVLVLEELGSVWEEKVGGGGELGEVEGVMGFAVELGVGLIYFCVGRRGRIVGGRSFWYWFRSVVAFFLFWFYLCLVGRLG